ncbi:MAG: hypothetical protein IKB85_00595 [Bacteroidales bacterium]|nr:hypothetical protein [Bacteroidales bacterium]
MNSILKKVITYLVLPACIAGLTYALVSSIMEPVQFEKHREYRKGIAVQRLKDIRDLQVAYKNVNGKYTADIDSLIMFYNEGKMKVVMQVGSQDDSVAVANTKALKKRKPKIKPEEMLKLYNEGQSLVFKIENQIAVKDTLFNDRENFIADSLAFIPFCGDSIIMASTVKKVSGVNVPLFEASMPYKSLLKGLNNQLRINLDAQCEDQGKYKGLQVGSITAPNNNAGNWE